MWINEDIPVLMAKGWVGIATFENNLDMSATGEHMYFH
jgi:hypothetical protein